MSALGALGIGHQPHAPDRRPVNPPDRPQEHQPSPPPPSKTPEAWTCRHPYKYSIKKTPQDALETCNEVVEKHDEKFCKELKDEIAFLMVVAGLFLAIVTAFTVESYKSLQEDKQDTIADLLVGVVQLLNDTNTQGHARLPKPFTPGHRDIVVNQLWFLSMMLSLVAVLLGTFCLQWISAFERGTDLTFKSASPDAALGMRHLRYEGLIGWGVSHAPDTLLLIVQLSITLFASGLVYFLWNVNHAAAIPTLVVTGITGILLCVVNVMPFLQPLVGVFWPKFMTFQCPYKSPASWLVLFACDILAFPLKRFEERWKAPRGTFGRFADWLKNRLIPWGDYVWKAHDTSCAYLRESWQVCSPLRSFGLGLSSAFDILVLDPDAADIIQRSIRSLRRAVLHRESEFLQNVFKQDLLPIEKDMLRSWKTPTNFFDPTLPPGSMDQHTQSETMRNDFFSALVFQHLVTRSAKLHSILQQHRAELYIRVKNSSLSIVYSPNEFPEFSRSLACPLLGFIDPDELPLELKFQFLNYVNRFLQSRHAILYNDLLIASTIIHYEPPEFTDPDWCPPGYGYLPSRIGETGMDEQQYMHRATSAAGGHHTYGNRMQRAGLDVSGIQHTGFTPEGSRHAGGDVVCGQGVAGVCEATDAEESATSYVNDAYGDHCGNYPGAEHTPLNMDNEQPFRPPQGPGFPGGMPQQGPFYNPWMGTPYDQPFIPPQPYSAFIGGQTPLPPMGSHQYGIYGKSAEDLQLRAAYRRVCLQVKQQIVTHALSPPHAEYKDTLWRILVLREMPENI